MCIEMYARLMANRKREIEGASASQHLGEIGKSFEVSIGINWVAVASQTKML